jgi:hypothetical protein
MDHGRGSCIVFGISGADTSTIFDSHSGLPCTGNNGGAQSTPGSCTLSTSNANDIIIGLSSAYSGSITGCTPGTGFTAINTGNCAPGSVDGDGMGWGEYEIFSSTQTSLSVSVAFGGNTHWAFIGDAIMAASGNVNYVFTISVTMSATPAVNANHVDKVTPSVSITPSVRLAHVDKLTASVTATPNVFLASVKTLVDTVTATPLVGLAHSALVAASVTVSAAISCLLNGAACPTIIPVVTGGDAANFMWLLSIPLMMVIMALMMRRRR